MAVAALHGSTHQPLPTSRPWHPYRRRPVRGEFHDLAQWLGPRAVGRGPRPGPGGRLPAGSRRVGRRRADHVARARRLPPSRLDDLRSDFRTCGRAIRPLQPGASLQGADLNPRVPAHPSDPGPDDHQRAAPWFVAGVRRMGGLPAGDRRGAGLRDRRQLRPHPLGAFGSPQPAHVEDFRAAADH